jgi:hypothetical protein
MHEAGWLRERDASEGGGFELPNFLRHNGSSAKARCVAATRQGAYRARTAEGGDAHVTPPARPQRNQRREEREEKNKIIQSRTARPPQPSTGGRAGGASTSNPPPPTQNPAPTDHDRGVGTSPELAGVDPRDRLKVLRQLVLAERARAQGRRSWPTD